MDQTISVVIPNYNSGGDLLSCLRSLHGQSLRCGQIIVIDNGSKDDSLELAVAAYPHTMVLRNRSNKGPAVAGNQGARIATNDLLMFLNPDVILSPDTAALLANKIRDGAGVAGPTHLVGPQRRREYGSTVDRLGHPTGLFTPGRPLFFPAATLLTSRQLFERIGGIDERYFMFAEDLDYCWRVLLSGADVCVVPEAEVVHHGGGSTPGGYVRDQRMEISSFRLVLRERNTLTTFLKCAPIDWLAWFLPAHIMKTAALAAGAVALGRVTVAGRLMRGVLWNLRELKTTYGLRRLIPRTRDGELSVKSRIYPGFLELDLVRRFGIPHFVDESKHTS